MSSIEQGFYADGDERREILRRINPGLAESYGLDSRRAQDYYCTPDDMIDPEGSDALWDAANYGDPDALFILGMLASAEDSEVIGGHNAVEGYRDPIVMPRPVGSGTKGYRTIFDLGRDCDDIQARLFDLVIASPSSRKVKEDDKQSKTPFDKA